MNGQEEGLEKEAFPGRYKKMSAEGLVEDVSSYVPESYMDRQTHSHWRGTKEVSPGPAGRLRMRAEKRGHSWAGPCSSGQIKPHT